MSPQARAESEALTREMSLEIEALDQLRKALNLTQEQIAALLETAQSNVSKLEKQQNMRISTLRLCEKEQEVLRLEKKEIVEVRNERIAVKAKVLECVHCKNEFDDAKAEDAPLELAYREYRLRKGLMQPEEIVKLRESYGLTQLEFANLLGWGIATLSRYEKGALRSDAHETALKLVCNSLNIAELLTINGSFLSVERRESLLQGLRVMGHEARWKAVEHLLRDEQGNAALDLYRLRQMVLFFCKTLNGVWKTKLNKLLFYSDFKCFKKHKRSISGSGYIAHHFGPVPVGYDQIYGWMATLSELDVREEEINEINVGEKLVSRKASDLTVFSAADLAVLEEVKLKFRSYTATKISEVSHDERAWGETSPGEVISYQLAAALRH
jgi:putative zinc finger/helix-turn-helix YgiT family protein